MTPKKLTFTGIKNVLSKEDMKAIMAGSGCLGLGSSCNAGVQCCSNNCAANSSDPVTGYTCQ
jgi:hypothetical protein